MRTGYVEDQPGWPAARQEEILLASGILPRRIYIEGRSSETFEMALRSVRPGDTLETAGGLRALGSTRALIMEGVAAADRHGHPIQDTETKQRHDQHGAVMLDAALKKIHGEKAIGDRAGEIGALGGKAKARAVRKDRTPNVTARSVWLSKSIDTDDEAIEQLHRWSKSTAYREFGKSGRPKGRRPSL